MGAQQFILAFSMIWDLKSLDREMISTVALRKTFNYDSEQIVLFFVSKTKLFLICFIHKILCRK
jgi:hypothetical protein